MKVKFALPLALSAAMAATGTTGYFVTRHYAQGKQAPAAVKDTKPDYGAVVEDVRNQAYFVLVRPELTLNTNATKKKHIAKLSRIYGEKAVLDALAKIEWVDLPDKKISFEELSQKYGKGGGFGSFLRIFDEREPDIREFIPETRNIVYKTLAFPGELPLKEHFTSLQYYHAGKSHFLEDSFPMATDMFNHFIITYYIERQQSPYSANTSAFSDAYNYHERLPVPHDVVRFAVIKDSLEEYLDALKERLFDDEYEMMHRIALARTYLIVNGIVKDIDDTEEGRENRLKRIQELVGRKLMMEVFSPYFKQNEQQFAKSLGEGYESKILSDPAGVLHSEDPGLDIIKNYAESISAIYPSMALLHGMRSPVDLFAYTLFKEAGHQYLEYREREEAVAGVIGPDGKPLDPNDPRISLGPRPYDKPLSVWETAPDPQKEYEWQQKQKTRAEADEARGRFSNDIRRLEQSLNAIGGEIIKLSPIKP